MARLVGKVKVMRACAASTLISATAWSAQWASTVGVPRLQARSSAPHAVTHLTVRSTIRRLASRSHSHDQPGALIERRIGLPHQLKETFRLHIVT